MVLWFTGGNHLSQLTLVGNNRGVDLAGLANGNVIEKNAVGDSTADGIMVGASTGNVVRHNTVAGNVFGITLSNHAHDNILAHHVSDGAPGFSFGISAFSDSDGNVVDRN